MLPMPIRWKSSGKLATTGDRLKYCVGVIPQTFEFRIYQGKCGFNSVLITRVKGDRPFLGAISFTINWCCVLLNSDHLKYETDEKSCGNKHDIYGRHQGRHKTLTRCQIESVDSLNQTVNDILNGIIAPGGAKPSVPNTSSAQHLCLLMMLTTAKNYGVYENLHVHL